jgi:uncharacterized coiled-coil protein SlyX
MLTFSIVAILIIQLLIFMNAQEALAALNDIKAQNTKALGEIRGKLDMLISKIVALEEAVANQQIPAAVADAIAELKASSQALDDIVPDDAPPA